MCKGLIGKKLGMTGIFSNVGSYIPITVLRVGPCVVTQIKKISTDGYKALQIGFEERKLKKTKKPLKGHFAKSGGNCFHLMKEVAVDNPGNYELGQVIGPELFEVGEKVDIRGTSKGRGFSGVIKRHGFSGGKKTHGSKSHRIPGSIGCSAWPGKVVKGKKMPGHYGCDLKIMRNIEIVEIRMEENIVLVRGSVPGFRYGKVFISKTNFTR